MAYRGRLGVLPRRGGGEAHHSLIRLLAQRRDRGRGGSVKQFASHDASVAADMDVRAALVLRSRAERCNPMCVRGSRRMRAASCFETPHHSASKTRVNALEARLLSMRAIELSFIGFTSRAQALPAQ